MPVSSIGTSAVVLTGQPITADRCEHDWHGAVPRAVLTLRRYERGHCLDASCPKGYRFPPERKTCIVGATTRLSACAGAGTVAELPLPGEQAEHRAETLRGACASLKLGRPCRHSCLHGAHCGCGECHNGSKSDISLVAERAAASQAPTRRPDGLKTARSSRPPCSRQGEKGDADGVIGWSENCRPRLCEARSLLSLQISLFDANNAPVRSI